MPGLVPGIHVLLAVRKVVDGRDKPGQDGFYQSSVLLNRVTAMVIANSVSTASAIAS
jgi:hypothetical protein